MRGGFSQSARGDDNQTGEDIVKRIWEQGGAANCVPLCCGRCPGAWAVNCFPVQPSTPKITLNASQWDDGARLQSVRGAALSAGQLRSLSGTRGFSPSLCCLHSGPLWRRPCCRYDPGRRLLSEVKRRRLPVVPATSQVTHLSAPVQSPQQRHLCQE